MSDYVFLSFGSMSVEDFSRASKLCGKNAVMSPDVARMAGANIAAGSPSAMQKLRERLEAGALSAALSEHPALSESAARWLALGERGVSSNTMFTLMTGVDAMGGSRRSHPHDVDDFNRCRGLLLTVPELADRLPMMASESPEWKALVDAWDTITRYCEAGGLVAADKLIREAINGAGREGAA